MSETQEGAGAGQPEVPEAPPGSGPEAGAEAASTPFLVLQFFVFPLAIVVVSVAVFVVFGMIASEGKGPREYVQEIRSGSANRRWQAAFELSRVIQAGDREVLDDERFVGEMLALFEESGDDDPRVRRYLALALGRLGDPRAVPVLLASLDVGEDRDPDSQTQLFAVWALGTIGDPAAVPRLVELTAHEDPGIRKTAAHALGGFDLPEAREALARLLEDATADVRWNAAVALAHARDARAVPILEQMMDADAMAQVPELSPAQREEAVLQAVSAAARLQAPELRAPLERLTTADPSLKVRDAARAALALLGHDDPTH